MKTQKEERFSLHSWILHFSNTYSYKHNIAGLGASCEAMALLQGDQKEGNTDTYPQITMKLVWGMR